MVSPQTEPYTEVLSWVRHWGQAPDMLRWRLRLEVTTRSLQ